MPGHERSRFDSREAVERTVLGGLGGFTLYSVTYFHSDVLEAEFQIIDLDPY